MLLELDLPVAVMDEEQAEQFSMGIMPNTNDFEFENCTFYIIENVKEIDKKLCCVSSGGAMYLVNKTATYVKNMIREKRSPYFN